MMKSNGMKYQPKHIQQVLGKSAETVRSWSVEFAEFLSAEANPSSGHRRYTDEDLQVLSYVNYRKAEGATQEQIVDELAGGQRADPPQEPAAVVAASERGEITLLHVRLAEAEQRIHDLEQQLAEAQTRADRAEGAIAYSDNLHRAELERVERRLADKEKVIHDLYLEIIQLRSGYAPKG